VASTCHISTSLNQPIIKEAHLFSYDGEGLRRSPCVFL
jgi:hypothetical protein